MRTAAPEKWEARMHGGHGLPVLLPVKNKTRRNMRDMRENEEEGADEVAGQGRGSDGGRGR